MSMSRWTLTLRLTLTFRLTLTLRLTLVRVVPRTLRASVATGPIQPAAVTASTAAARPARLPITLVSICAFSSSLHALAEDDPPSVRWRHEGERGVVGPRGEPPGQRGGVLRPRVVVGRRDDELARQGGVAPLDPD